MKFFFIIFSFIFAVSALADTNSFFPTNSIIYIDDFADYDTESTFIDTKPIPQSFLETTADKIERIAVINSNPGKYSKKEEGDQFTVAAKSFFSVNKDVTDKVATKLFVFGGFGDSVKDDLIYADKDFSIGENCDVQSTKIVDCSGYSYYELVTSNYIWSTENTNWIAYGSSKSVKTKEAPQNASGCQTGEVLTDRAVLHTRLTRPSSVSGVDGYVVFIIEEKNGTPVAASAVSHEYKDYKKWTFIQKVYKDKKIPGQKKQRNRIHHNYRWTVTGLIPFTEYKYKIRTKSVDGVNEYESDYTFFKTLPLPSAPTDVKFTVISGMMVDFRDSGRNGHKIFDSMLTQRDNRKPDFIVLTGDTVYYDSGDMNGKSKWLNWAHTYKWGYQKAFFRKVPGYWQVDDHDYWRNNINKTQPKGWNVFRKSNPTPGGYLFPGDNIDNPEYDISDEAYNKSADYYKDDYGACDGDGTNYWRTFRYGRNLQIWLEEGHHHRFKNKESRNEYDKLKIWGDTQLNWLVESINNSIATYKFLITTTPMAGPSKLIGNSGQDKHSGSKFRTETDKFLAAVCNVSNFHIICGDRHWKYHSNFLNGDYAHIQEFCCGPTSDKHSQSSYKNKHFNSKVWSKPRWSWNQKEGGGYLDIKVIPVLDANKELTGTKLEVAWKDDEGITRNTKYYLAKDSKKHESKFINPWPGEPNNSIDLTENIPSDVTVFSGEPVIEENKPVIVKLTWDSPTNADNVYGYEIQGPNSNGEEDAFRSVVSTETEITTNWLYKLPNGNYTFKIWAINKNGAHSENSKDTSVEINVSPVVASSTHPNQDMVYDLNELKAVWEIAKINEKFITSYRYLIDQNPLTELDENNKLFTEEKSITKNIEDFENGTYFFHIQSKSEMNDKIYWSKTAHYKFNIKKGVPVGGKPESGIWFK